MSFSNDLWLFKNVLSSVSFLVVESQFLKELPHTKPPNNNLESLHVEAIGRATVILYTTRMQASIVVMHYDAIVIDHKTFGITSTRIGFR